MFNVQFPINDQDSNVQEVPMRDGDKNKDEDEDDERQEPNCKPLKGIPGDVGKDGTPKYDLLERTARFGEAIIAYAKSLPVTPVTRGPIGQLVDAGTSVGANYAEANEGVSRKDFRNKIGTSQKEANETKYWLRMMAAAVPEKKSEARPLWQEAKELHLIFAKIFRSCGRGS
jgi:four helix bundle protein